jgi:hypothetical protein
MKLAQRLSNLSPEQRKLFESRLKKQDIDILMLPILKEARKIGCASIEPAEEKDYYMLSSAQERFYLLHRMIETDDSTGYNMHTMIELTGTVDRGKLESVFRKMIQRQQNFRTSFHMLDSEPVQRIHKNVEFEIEGVDAVERFIRPFDLSHAPLLRVGLIKKEENIHILVVDVHHIISDGTSQGIIIKEFISLYRGENLPPLRIQYKDYLQWQKSGEREKIIKEQEAYWLKELSPELPVLNMPTDFPRPDVQSFEGDMLHFHFEEGLVRELKMLMKETGTTLYMMLLALLNVLLFLYTGQEDIIIGSPIAGRNHGALQDIIGLLMETIVTRNYPDEEKTFERFLLEVKENTLKAFENQEYPFGELLKLIDYETGAGRNPLFDVMLVVQNPKSRIKVSQLGELKVKPYDGNFHKSSKVDISMDAVEKDQQVLLRVEYCTKLYKKESIEAFMDSFQKVAETVVNNKTIMLKDIKISHHLETAAASIYENPGQDVDFEF